jgi:CHASE2 domain-containing sensor protein
MRRAQGILPAQGWLLALATMLLGALVGWLVGRRGDREAQGTLTVAGAMTTFVGASLWAFLSYKQWAPLLGLS